MSIRRIFLLISIWLLAIVAHAQMCRLFSTDNGLTSSLVNHVLEDKYGVIWIATEDGLNRYDGVKLSTYKHVEGDSTSLACNYVSAMIEDADGNLVISTYTGLQLYRHDTNDFSSIGAYTDGVKMKANISDLMLEQDGRLYGTGDVDCEIKVLNRDRIEVCRLQTPHFSNKTLRRFPAKLHVRTSMRFDNSHLLLGTDGCGVMLYDESSENYTDFPLDLPGIPQDLLKVHHMLRDRKGNLWLALYQKGVAMVSLQKSRFGYVGAKSSKHNLIGSHCVQSIFRSSSGGMWVGTDGDGLYYIADGKSQHFSDQVPPIINAVLEDSKGVLWIGSYGYPCYKREGGQFCQVAGLPEQSNVFALQEDRRHDIWMGTMGYGLFRYDRASNVVLPVDQDWVNPYINCISFLSSGNLLIGTFNGIYNISTHQHSYDRHIVYCMYEDVRGRLWLGTADGLVVEDKECNRIYTTADGMPSNTVYAISEDAHGRIWFSSNAGLSCFDVLEEVFTNYSVNDGLQGNEFSKGTISKDADGTLWFAGHEGITYFQSSHINQSRYSLHPRITALYINNVPVSSNTTTGGESVIDTALFDAKRFSIAYENNSFSIELSAAEIDRPAQCGFCYSMDGGNWVSIPDGGHLVSFSNLEAGLHSLRYAVEYNGQRSEVEEVCIEVRHPWWGELWAKCLLGLLSFLLLTMLFFWVRSQEKVKALALISHKIRTPMSLIISPLVQLLDNETDEQKKRTFRMMLRNAEKLQQLAAQATEEEPIGPIEIVEECLPKDEEQVLNQSRTTRQLLIVEDDDDVRRYLCEQLSSDYHVREAVNGRVALDLIFEKLPDAIISDVTMPEMDGISLCKKLKKNIKLAHIPVILLTARADEESTLQGLGIGADAYITKPFNIKILRQNISNLILLRQQLRNTYQDQLLQEDKQEDVEVVDYEDLFMQRLMDCINQHIGDKELSVETICQEVGISRAQLHRRLKEKTNQSTSIFVRNVRLRQAEKLLRESNMRVNEVSDKVGFAQITYFCSAFKELYGVSPTEFREKLKN